MEVFQLSGAFEVVVGGYIRSSIGIHGVAVHNVVFYFGKLPVTNEFPQRPNFFRAPKNISISRTAFYILSLGLQEQYRSTVANWVTAYLEACFRKTSLSSFNV